jgi:tetratricopeptide (TPR) repeat protein
MDSSARVKNNLAFYIAERNNLNDKQRAMTMAESAVEYDEKNQAAEYLPASWDTLGYVLLRFAETPEEIERAVEYFNKALALAPDDVDYNKHKITAQIALGT